MLHFWVFGIQDLEWCGHGDKLELPIVQLLNERKPNAWLESPFKT